MTNVVLHYGGDLPNDVVKTLKSPIAMDCEMNRNLNWKTGKLCLVKIKGADDTVTHLVKFDVSKKYNAPNLAKILENKDLAKLFHYPRKDLCFLSYKLKCSPVNILCTKLISKIVRGNAKTTKHNLDILCKELLGITLDKGEQRSIWENAELTQRQIKYAALDVEHLHAIFNALLAKSSDLNKGTIKVKSSLHEEIVKADLKDSKTYQDEDLFQY
jgi:ribonuclease D